MPKSGTNNALHLPKLSISGFRGIRKLEIGELGRVTLLTGKNGIGKTTVLEAVRIFASRGRSSSVWRSVLQGHDEYLLPIQGEPDEDASSHGFDLDSIFYGRELSDKSTVLIGTPPKQKQLEIRRENTKGKRGSERIQVWREVRWPLVASYGGREYPVPISHSTQEMRWLIRRMERGNSRGPDPVVCFAIGPGLLRNEEVAQLWDRAVLLGAEHYAIEALKLVCGEGLERIVIVGAEQETIRTITNLRAVAKFKNRERPVPLRSLGDGAVRILGLALSLAVSRGGFLLIDEAENGIHYSVQAEVWRLLLRMAEENNVQVIATTHGWDCIEKFAEVAWEDKEIKGMLINLEDAAGDGNLQTVEYPEKALVSAIRHGFDVR